MQSSFAHERGFAQTRSALAEDAANPGRAPDYAPLVADLRQAFLSGKTKSYEWRVRELQQMRRMLVESEAKILAAVKKDLNKHPVEAFQAEVGLIVSDIDLALANLRTWMADESVSHPLLAQPGSSKYVKQPKGVALIIGAWNYPFQLSLLPLVSAVAAGCAAVLKPSELAVESARVMEEMVHQYMDKSLYRVVQGGVPETTALLKERYDHVFYTGNGAVGRVVYQAAAKHLTPVTLELGGKSPAYVAPDAKLDVVVKRLIGTKFFNMGQTCIAPDYVLVHASIKERFVQAAVKTVKEFWGEDPSKSTSYGRIINERHFDRVKSMIDEQHGGKVVCGGSANAKREARFIPPTIVLDPSLASRLMSEEIFGPVLPVVTVESLDQALAVINDREPSLASYVFSESKDTADKFITNIVSGGTCVNDALYHAVNPALKFGGVGASGLGAYHGKAGFDEFTHARPVMFRDTWLDNAQRYPPLKEEGLDMLRRILVGPFFPEHVVRGAKVAAGLGLVAAVALRGRL